MHYLCSPGFGFCSRLLLHTGETYGREVHGIMALVLHVHRYPGIYSFAVCASAAKMCKRSSVLGISACGRSELGVDTPRYLGRLENP